MGQFDGKVAIVTGAGKGIGQASALLFAEHGAAVVVADIDEDAAKVTTEQVRSAGGEAVAVAVDVASRGDVERMVRTAVDTFGGLDFAHNNAGMAVGAGMIVDYDDDRWQRAIDVMLTGVFHCMKHEIAAMLERGGGAIVNTGSGAGLVGFPQQYGYVAAKHGMLGLTKVAALDYGPLGIRVNAVCPGTASTPMVAEAVAADPQLDDYLKSLHPIGRIGTAREIAEAAIWLCSDSASFVLGHALSVDGGYVIH